MGSVTETGPAPQPEIDGAPEQVAAFDQAAADQAPPPPTAAQPPPAPAVPAPPPAPEIDPEKLLQALQVLSGGAEKLVVILGRGLARWADDQRVEHAVAQDAPQIVAALGEVAMSIDMQPLLLKIADKPWMLPTMSLGLVLLGTAAKAKEGERIPYKTPALPAATEGDGH